MSATKLFGRNQFSRSDIFQSAQFQTHSRPGFGHGGMYMSVTKLQRNRDVDIKDLSSRAEDFTLTLYRNPGVR